MKRELSTLLDLLERRGPSWHALLTRLTLRPDIADDLLQELFLRLRDADGFRTATDPEGYATRAAVHLAFDWRRRQCRGPVIGALDGDPVGLSASPLVALVQRERLEELLSALDALPEPGRTIIVLRYLEQESYEAIAGPLGKTAHQARALAHKALGRLRKTLGGDAARCHGTIEENDDE